MIKIYWFVLAAMFFTLSGTALAQTWTLDKDHTEIRFDVQHIFSTVSGRFSDVDAAVVFDQDRLGDSRFDFTVNVKSIDTFNTKRDTHLRSKDFFNAEMFPAMRFVSSRIHHVEGNRYTLEGQLTIKDVTRPLQIQFVHHGPKIHPLEKTSQVAGFDATFTIDRLDYKVGDGRFFKLGVVGNLVHISISTEVLRKN